MRNPKHASTFQFLACNMLANVPWVQSEPYGETRGRVGGHYMTKDVDTL